MRISLWIAGRSAEVDVETDRSDQEILEQVACDLEDQYEQVVWAIGPPPRRYQRAEISIQELPQPVSQLRLLRGVPALDPSALKELEGLSVTDRRGDRVIGRVKIAHNSERGVEVRVVPARGQDVTGGLVHLRLGRNTFEMELILPEQAPLPVADTGSP